MNQTRPAPNSGSPFDEGLAQGVVRYLRCTACGAPQTLTRAVCARCGGHALQWRDAGGTGTVYASTVVHIAHSDEFRALLPYTLVLVDLDEGPRVMGHGTPGLAIGVRVQVRIRAFAGRPVPAFEPEPGGLR